MDLERKEGESKFDHHKRLVYGKLVDRTLADMDYSELSEYVYGKQYASDSARRMFYGSRHTLQLLEEKQIDCIEDHDVLSELDMKIIELRKEQQKLSDQRTAFNKSVRERSRQEELNEILTKAVQDGSLPKLEYEHKYLPKTDTVMLISLNDIHYGAVVDNAWRYYDSDKCIQMMADYLDHIFDIQERHCISDCIVYNCGDSISGNIHTTVQISNKENVVEQIKGVSELVSDFLAELSTKFRSVSYVSVAGNHSRLSKNKDEAVLGERLDDLIEWYLQARLQDFENVHICSEARIDPSMFVINVKGKTYCGVHGDFDDSPTKLASLRTFVGQSIYAVLCGHKHHNKTEYVEDTKIVMAGSFVGIDDYCIQKRIYGRPQQMICICDDTGIICHYDIDL